MIDQANQENRNRFCSPFWTRSQISTSWSQWRVKRGNNRANHQIHNLEDHPVASFIAMESNLWFPHFWRNTKERERGRGRGRGRGGERKGKKWGEDKATEVYAVIKARQLGWTLRRSIFCTWHPPPARGIRARQVNPRARTKQRPDNLQARVQFRQF